MPGEAIGDRLGIQRLAKDGDVHVTQPFDLALGQALGDQRLLHLGDLARADVLEQPGELGFDVIDRRPCVELADQPFQNLLAFCVIVDRLAHWTTPYGVSRDAYSIVQENGIRITLSGKGMD